jgi:hypothetical protein
MPGNNRIFGPRRGPFPSGVRPASVRVPSRTARDRPGPRPALGPDRPNKSRSKSPWPSFLRLGRLTGETLRARPRRKDSVWKALWPGSRGEVFMILRRNLYGKSPAGKTRGRGGDRRIPFERASGKGFGGPAERAAGASSPAGHPGVVEAAGGPGGSQDVHVGHVRALEAKGPAAVRLAGLPGHEIVPAGAAVGHPAAAWAPADRV